MFNKCEKILKLEGKRKHNDYGSGFGSTELVAGQPRYQMPRRHAVSV
jgi:hypothetical protein